MQAKGLTENDKVLLIGDRSNAFLDSGRSFGSRLQECTSLAQAVSLIAKEPFVTIYVQMSSIKGISDADLSSLKPAGSRAKIVLLAQMFEEPEARRLLRTARNFSGIADDYLICPVNGDLALIEPQAAPAAAADEKIIPARSTDEQITELRARIRQLELLATEDDLTGLKNRRYVREFLHQIIQRARQEEISVTLFIFDIDDFKNYNDKFGHAVGDNVLKQAAVMMKRCCRDHDVIGRIGGDEFAVVFWEKLSHETKSRQPERRQSKSSEPPREAYAICERFRQEISLSRLTSLGVDGQGELTVSGGLASFPRDGDTVEKLLEEADKAMLDAKQGGKNRIYLVGKER